MTFGTDFDDEIQKIKNSKQYKDTIDVWRLSRCNSVKNAGCCSEIAKRYIRRFKNYNIQSFEKYYYKNGKTEEELTENALKFKQYLNDAGIEISEDDAKKYTWIRIIYDTYQGIVVRETAAIEKIKEDLPDAQINLTDPETDRKYNIDIIAECGDINHAFQIKPISFLKGIQSHYRTSIMRDFNKIMKSHEAYEKENENTMIIWLFYDGADWILKYENEIKDGQYDYTN